MTNEDRAHGAPQGHDGPLHRDRGREPAGGLLSSSRAAGRTAIRPLRSSTCSRASTKKIVGCSARPTRSLWADTAIFITFDEGGGYYDSGYVQPRRLLRRRHPHPDDRGLALHQGRPHLAHVYRSRLDPEVHRAELGVRADHATAAATTCPTPSVPTTPTFRSIRLRSAT